MLLKTNKSELLFKGIKRSIQFFLQTCNKSFFFVYSQNMIASIILIICVITQGIEKSNELNTWKIFRSISGWRWQFRKALEAHKVSTNKKLNTQFIFKKQISIEYIDRSKLRIFLQSDPFIINRNKLNNYLLASKMKNEQRDFYSQELFRYNTIIDQVVLVGLHDSLKIKHDTHQLKWITNLKIITGKQYEQQSRHGHREPYSEHIKFIEIGNNLFLKIFYCQEDEHPILKLKTVIKTPLNQNNVVPYPANILFQECIIFERYLKAEYQRLIQDLEMVQVSGDKDLQIPQGQSYEVIRLPIQCQTIPQENSSNQQLIQKTRYLLIKTFDFDDADKINQYFQSTVKQVHRFKNHKNLVCDSVFHQFCFPLGVQISKQQIKTGYQIFNFILTQEDGERMYVNCLKFSEKLPDEEVEKLPSNFVDKNLHKNEIFYTEQIFCIISRFCYTDFFRDLLQKIFKKFLSVNTPKLQKKYKKIDPKNDQNHQENQDKFTNIMKQFIASYEQGFQRAEHTLRQIQVMRESVRIQMKWFHDTILFPQPDEDNPTNYSSKAICTLFGVLEVDKIMQIILSILLERKVLFISQSQMILGHVIQSFLSFLYPIQWKHPILPIILEKLIQYLEAPVPLIAGILTSIVDDQLIENLTQTTIVFLDCNEIINKDMDLKIKDVNHLREATHKLRSYQLYTKDSAEQILLFQSHYFFFKQAECDFSKRFSGEHVKNIFFQTILLFLQNYGDHYISKAKQSTVQSPRSSNGGFDFKRHYSVDNFIRSHPRSLHKFMEKFILTSHFINFIHKFHKGNLNSHKNVIDRALSMQKNHKSPIHSSKSEQFRYSEQPKIDNNEINQLRKKVSLEHHRNTTWSPPPKKSQVSTNYTQNIDRFSLRLEDVQFERDKSVSNGVSSHEKKTRGGNICEAISKVVSQASRTKMLMWTIARVSRLKKKIFGGSIEEENEKKEPEKPNRMEEQQDKRENKCN